MPSLVIDARMIDASGIGVYLKNIIPFLVTEFDICLLGDKERLEEFAWAKETKILPLTSSIYTLKEQWELKKHIPKCDIFWSPHYNIPLLPIPAAKRVVTIHDTYHLAYKHTLSIAQKVFASIFLNAAVRISDKVLTVSEFSKEQLTHFTSVRKKRIDVLYNAVDHEVYKPISKITAREKLKALLPGLPSTFILYVGNVKPHKNVKTLVKAYSGLQSGLKQEYSLVIVGKKEGFLTPDSDLLKMFENDPSLEERIYFTGHVSDQCLPLLYNSASLFVFPSFYEGFGLPPLEAMACGCPVIASDAASIPEICGEAALYFNPKDGNMLQQLMDHVLLNDATQRELREKGLRHCSNYSWLRSAQEHSRVFRELLAAV